ncbi:uncharacterized protein B0I36DRAFT_319635 [Microdochium trichocladiopsis]|uniref:Uncharacterized protein n=1 Tax=Microdochium trichocladiopsis TaxID=1682393 RepID=A0A9P9BNY7_9PEZI|nr:uncharacterized protein B0I36DRAFT_319635 [Microdochium trichocladiopsis]KAH7032574.1 hypothetical protein B0I36DRAFT_319635 [Microdochium trichocladiopsis]
MLYLLRELRLPKGSHTAWIIKNVGKDYTLGMEATHSMSFWLGEIRKARRRLSQEPSKNIVREMLVPQPEGRIFPDALVHKLEAVSLE